MKVSVWRRRSVFAVVLAAFLALVMVTPAVAEGEQWKPSEKILGSGGANHKYSFDYSSREYVGGNQWSYNSQPVKGEVHPAQTAYERKVAARNAAAAEKPLTGKIIQPGKTVVRIPSTYGPVTKFATGIGGALGASRLLGSIGLGIGGTSLAPANFKEIGLSQGVPESCYNKSNYVCSAVDVQKMFMISSCAQFPDSSANSCNNIGAKGTTGESDVQKWFLDEALPFLDDLWAQITGQKNGEDVPSDTHQEVTYGWGCRKQLDFEYKADGPGGVNSGTVHVTSSRIVAPKPTSPAQHGVYWDSKCSAAARAEVNVYAGLLKATCVDSKGFTTGSGAGFAMGSYGLEYGFVNTYIDTVTGVVKVGLCNHRNTVNQPVKLAMVEIINTNGQSFFNTANASNYVSQDQYSRWIAPEFDGQEDTKITTTWQCRTNDGSYTHTFSKSVAKTSALINPVCAPGSQLVNHEVKQTDANGGNPRTLDAGQEVAGAAGQYPGCLSGTSDGCTLDVYVDGQVCTVARQECKTWPTVQAIQPSRVECKWGSYKVPVANCNAIANGYQSETGVVYDPRADTWVAIDVNGNPIQPNPQPWNPTNPNPVVGQQPGTATPPATGGGTGTSNPIPTEGSNPANDSKNCIAAMWTWNPVDWVYVPGKCVLTWAFVPKQEVLDTKGQQIRTKLGELGIDEPIAAVESTVAALPQGGGCAGPTIVFQLRSVHQELQPLNACAEPMATVAAFANAAGSLYLVLFGSIAFVKALSGAFGYQWYFGGKGDTDS